MYCLCVNVYSHRVTTQLKLINIYHIISYEKEQSVKLNESDRLLFVTSNIFIPVRPVTFIFQLEMQRAEVQPCCLCVIYGSCFLCCSVLVRAAHKFGFRLLIQEKETTSYSEKDSSLNP